MEHTIPLETTDTDSVHPVSLNFQDVNETVQNIQAIVAALLRYAELGASIAGNLLEWSVTPACNEI